MSLIKEYRGFKVGDTILITNKPMCWSSRLNTNNPLEKVIFPHKLTILKISNLGSMSCKDYGWDLDSILNSGYEKVGDEVYYEVY